MKAQGTYLEKMAARAKAELPARQKAKAPALLQTFAKAAPKPPAFESALRRAPANRVLAEIKRRTPERFLDRDLDLAEAAREFEKGGAAALVVATEGPQFGGSTEDLARVRAGSKLPLVRRDAFIDPYQLAEARIQGASAVWLVAGMLEGKALPQLLKAAAELGLEALVEVHDAEDLSRALDAGAAGIVIDPRDPKTLVLDPALVPALAAAASRAGALVVAGPVRGPEDAARLVAEGADAVVAGTFGITAGDRAKAIADCVAART